MTEIEVTVETWSFMYCRWIMNTNPFIIESASAHKLKLKCMQGNKNKRVQRRRAQVLGAAGGQM